MYQSPTYPSITYPSGVYHYCTCGVCASHRQNNYYYFSTETYVPKHRKPGPAR